MIKNLLIGFNWLLITIMSSSCCKNDMTLEQIAGTYNAIDDCEFGDRIILYEDGNAQEIIGSSCYNMSFYKSKCNLFFSTGNDASINSDGDQFCFSTTKCVTNIDYTNDDDGYDDDTGEAISEYVDETITHRYRKY